MSVQLLWELHALLGFGMSHSESSLSGMYCEMAAA